MNPNSQIVANLEEKYLAFRDSRNDSGERGRIEAFAWACSAAWPKIIRALRAEQSGPAERDAIAIVRRVLKDCGGAGLTILNGPCVFCGYNGAGYWQRGTHAKDCPFHNVGGEIERADHIQPRQSATDR